MRAAGQGAVVRRDGQAHHAQRPGAEAAGWREIMSAAPVAASAIAALIKDAMMAVGVPAADAAKVAELMLEADLTGADAHGVFRLPQYIRRIKAGGVNPKAQHHGGEDRAGDRHGRWRQRHGPSGDAARRRHRDRAGEGERRRLGRRAAEQPRRRGRHLRGDDAAARHDRHLFRGRQRQSHAGLGRGRKPAQHQSDRDRGAGRRGAAGGARHRHHGRLLRHGEGLQAPGQADAGRLDGRAPRTASRSPIRRRAARAC